MNANQADFPIAAMARMLGVSKAGYYAWAGRQPSARRTADAALLKRIRTEPPRVSRRLQLLRDWSHDEAYPTLFP